jgi:pyrophosphatase PpaX
MARCDVTVRGMLGQGATICRMETPPCPDPSRPALPDPLTRLAGLQAVVFDLDGTLIDSVDLIRISFRYATESVLGQALPDEVTMANVGQPLATQFAEMAPEHADELLRVYREFNSAHHDELARAYPGTLETLRRIEAMGIPMGIVTSKGTESATRGIERFGLAPFMSAVVTADDVKTHKPDPYPLCIAAGRLGVELGYCIYLGDSPHDVQAAISGDAIAVAALWGAFGAEELLAPGPAFALRSIIELPALLDGDAERFAVGR